jgi:hypothetical protein
MQQNRVARICQETCEARCQRKKCPQGYREEGVLYETMFEG